MTLLGVGMDIFWNCTFSTLVTLAILLLVYNNLNVPGDTISQKWTILRLF